MFYIFIDSVGIIVSDENSVEYVITKRVTLYIINYLTICSHYILKFFESE